jgi:hypothetical protein
MSEVFKGQVLSFIEELSVHLAYKNECSMNTGLS